MRNYAEKWPDYYEGGRTLPVLGSSRLFHNAEIVVAAI